jgi:hypothetical protein
VNTGRIALVTGSGLARLIILGDGPLHPELERRGAELELTEDVSLPGLPLALAMGITHALAGRAPVPPPESWTPYDQAASVAAFMDLLEVTP